MQKTTLFLFDVDGVLVNPIAYRAGISKTLELLYEKIGLRNAAELLPTEDEISKLESVGVHDVWDITNMLFASVLCSIAHSPASSETAFASSIIEDKLKTIAKTKPIAKKPSIEVLADKLTVNPTAHPPDVFFSSLTEQLRWSFTGNEKQQAEWTDLVNSFLRTTRNPYDSYGTRLFQNIILGSDEFAATYGLQSEYDGPSLLKLQDEVLISPQSVSELQRLSNAKSSDVRIAVYTARPSLPPKNAPDATKGYSPEAELALEIAGMTSYPLVGMGMMEWLATNKNERTEDLTKPNTTQAIAALIACTTQETTAATLEQAYAIDKLQKNPSLTPLATLKDSDVTVFVFEDTISGVLPMIAAAERLNKSGYSITIQPLGIAHDTEKRAALEKHCARVFTDVNAAIEFAVSSTS